MARDGAAVTGTGHADPEPFRAQANRSWEDSAGPCNGPARPRMRRRCPADRRGAIGRKPPLAFAARPGTFLEMRPAGRPGPEVRSGEARVLRDVRPGGGRAARP